MAGAATPPPSPPRPTANTRWPSCCRCWTAWQKEGAENRFRSGHGGALVGHHLHGRHGLDDIAVRYVAAEVVLQHPHGQALGTPRLADDEDGHVAHDAHHQHELVETTRPRTKRHLSQIGDTTYHSWALRASFGLCRVTYSDLENNNKQTCPGKKV